MSFFIPPLFYGIYAIAKYQKASPPGKTQTTRFATLPTLIFSVIATFSLAKLGLYSSNKEINNFNKYLYDKYKDEVVRPEYRGLKLHNGKKVYQIDNKEFTTSNFDDLKELVSR